MDSRTTGTFKKTILKVGDKLTIPGPTALMRKINMDKGMKVELVFDPVQQKITVYPLVKVHRFDVPYRIVGGIYHGKGKETGNNYGGQGSEVRDFKKR